MPAQGHPTAVDAETPDTLDRVAAELADIVDSVREIRRQLEAIRNARQAQR